MKLKGNSVSYIADEECAGPGGLESAPLLLSNTRHQGSMFIVFLDDDGMKYIESGTLRADRPSGMCDDVYCHTMHALEHTLLCLPDHVHGIHLI